MFIKNSLRKLLIETINDNYGYHVGSLRDKSEFIGEKAFGARMLANNNISGPSRTGHFGAGHFLFGSKEQAEEFKKTKDRVIYKIDFNQYNLFRPENPENFVESVIDLTNQLIMVTEDFTSSKEFNEVITQLIEDLPTIGVRLSDKQVYQITKGFINDVVNNKNPKGDYLITRYLKAMGYEGINFKNTPYDSYFIGSVIYDLKPNTISEA